MLKFNFLHPNKNSYIFFVSILGIAVERFFAVKYPLRVKTFITKSRIIVGAVVVIWFYSAFVNLSPLVLDWNNWIPGMSCDLVLVYPKLFLDVFIIASFSIVLIVILFLYASIFKVLTERKKGIQCNETFSEVVQKQRIKMIERDAKITKSLSIVVITFALCFVPMCIVLVMCMYSPILRSKLWYVRMVANIAAFLNSGLNPVIYAIRLPQFKVAFRDLLHLKKKNEGTLVSGEGLQLTETVSVSHDVQSSINNDLRREHQHKLNCTNKGNWQLRSFDPFIFSKKIILMVFMCLFKKWINSSM